MQIFRWLYLGYGLKFADFFSALEPSESTEKVEKAKKKRKAAQELV